MRLSSLLVIWITPDPAVLVVCNCNHLSNGRPYMWQMMYRSSIKLSVVGLGMQA